MVTVNVHERREARIPSEKDIVYVKTDGIGGYATFYLREKDDETVKLLDDSNGNSVECESHRTKMAEHCVRELGYNEVLAESGDTMAELQII